MGGRTCRGLRPMSSLPHGTSPLLSKPRPELPLVRRGLRTGRRRSANFGSGLNEDQNPLFRRGRPPRRAPLLRRSRGRSGPVLLRLAVLRHRLACALCWHPKVFGYHRLLSRRFPYAVYYTLEEDLAVVWRVLDLRRHPDRIRRALEDWRTKT